MTSEERIEIRQKIDNCTTIAHHIMAVYAGYMITYCILAKGTGITSAMTLNLIDLVFAIMGRTPLEVMLRVLALAVYVAAVVMFTWMRIKTKVCLPYVSLILHLFALAAVTFLPEKVDPMILSYPMFFAFSFQYNAFPGCYGYGASTVFNSNNTRQTAIAFTEYALTRDPEKLKKGKFFLETILCFHGGIAVAWIFVRAIGQWASLLSIVLLVISFLFVKKGNRLGDKTFN